MKLPSIQLLLAEAGRTARRFPLVLLTAFLAAVAAIGLTDSGDDESLTRLLFAGTLGLSLLTATAVSAERWSGTRPGRILLNSLGAVLLVVVWVLYPGWLDPVALRRYLQLSIGFHLLVAFLPYFRVSERNGFWQFNRVLFLRFLVAALYSAVLYIGLSVALLALDQLFGFTIGDSQYIRLLILISFVFHPWFFLGGVPRDFAELESRTDYPTGLKVFSQYILVPIVSLYLLILTAYLGKVLITRDWPSGWIGYLVSSVAAVGMLSLLLVHPIRERTENRWVAAYSRWFYLALFPSVVMLLVAIWKRVEQYGITENRYFLIVLSVWLSWISLYFIFGRSRNIKAIPLSLAILALGTSFGPWGAYAVSEASQVRRLTGLLEQEEILVEGRIRSAASGLSDEMNLEIAAVLTYLLDTHGRDPLERWFSAELDSADAEAPDGRAVSAIRTTRIMNAMGLEYVHGLPRGEAGRFYYSATREAAWEVGGYRHALRVNASLPYDFTLDGLRYRLETARGGEAIALKSPKGEELVLVPLLPLLERVGTAPQATGQEPEAATRVSIDVEWVGTAPQATGLEPLVVEGEGPGGLMKLVIYNVRGRKEGGETVLEYFEAEVLIRLGP